MPFLSTNRIALVDSRSFTQRRSVSTQKRWVCKFGKKRRRVLLLACDTLLPVIGRLPVIWHTLAIPRIFRLKAAQQFTQALTVEQARLSSDPRRL